LQVLGVRAFCYWGFENASETTAVWERFFGGRSSPAPADVSAADFLIRRAGPADVPELARLRYTFRIELDPPVEAETEFDDLLERR
jgi:hypothetical protein